jgi:hypothetical protein
MSIRCNQQRAAHANPSKRKTSMARSLTKAPELKKTDRRTAMADKEVEALKFQKRVTRADANAQKNRAALWF